MWRQCRDELRGALGHAQPSRAVHLGHPAEEDRCVEVAERAGPGADHLVVGADGDREVLAGPQLIIGCGPATRATTPARSGTPW